MYTKLKPMKLEKEVIISQTTTIVDKLEGKIESEAI